MSVVSTPIFESQHAAKYRHKACGGTMVFGWSGLRKYSRKTSILIQPWNWEFTDKF